MLKDCDKTYSEMDDREQWHHHRCKNCPFLIGPHAYNLFCNLYKLQMWEWTICFDIESRDSHLQNRKEIKRHSDRLGCQVIDRTYFSDMEREWRTVIEVSFPDDSKSFKSTDWKDVLARLQAL